MRRTSTGEPFNADGGKDLLASIKYKDPESFAEAGYVSNPLAAQGMLTRGEFVNPINRALTNAREVSLIAEFPEFEPGFITKSGKLHIWKHGLIKGRWLPAFVVLTRDNQLQVFHTDLVEMSAATCGSIADDDDNAVVNTDTGLSTMEKSVRSFG